MSATFEIWLCDDAGRRMHLFEKFAFLSYSRTTQGRGALQLGTPFDDYTKAVPSVFRVDWRIDVWRSPDSGIPARREGSFLLRRFNVYQRTGDNMRIIEFYGVSPVDILRRQCWETNAAQTDYLDDIMKVVVNGMFVTNPSATSTAPTIVNGSTYTYTGEFAVDEEASDGPIVTASFYLQNVLDILNDLRKSSVVLNKVSSSNKKIFFDVIEDDSLVSGGFGYRFRTYPSLRGADRTTGIVFSPENGNLVAPVYYEDYGEQITGVYLYNQSGLLTSAQSDDRYLSRWNFVKMDKNTDKTNAASALNDAYATLKKNGVDKQMNTTFLNSPGSQEQPRSLYGLDWDLGDLLRVQYVDKVMDVEVAIVYISTNELGEEKVTGKTIVGEG